MATALRRLAKDYASGGIDREEYLRRRKQFIDDAVSGRQELKEEAPRRAAPAPVQAAAAAAAREPARAGRSGLLIGAAVAVLFVIAGGAYLFWPSHKPKPTPAALARHKGTDPAQFVKDFLAKGDWGHASVEQLVEKWASLDADTRKQVEQSPSYGFLDDAIYEQIVEEQQLADLGDRKKAVAAQEFLAGVARQLGMTDDRFKIAAKQPPQKPQQTAVKSGEVAPAEAPAAAAPAPASRSSLAATSEAQPPAAAEAPVTPPSPEAGQTSAPNETSVAEAGASGAAGVTETQGSGAPAQESPIPAPATTAAPAAESAQTSTSAETGAAEAAAPAEKEATEEKAPIEETTAKAKAKPEEEAKLEPPAPAKESTTAESKSEQGVPEATAESGTSALPKTSSPTPTAAATEAKTTAVAGAPAAGTTQKKAAAEQKPPSHTAEKAASEQAKAPVKAAAKPKAKPEAVTKKQAAPAAGRTTAKAAAAGPNQASNRYACRAALANSRRPYCRDDLADGGHGPVMVVIPAGSFRMGGSRPDEKPIHEVHIPRPLAVSMHEISFREFEQFCKATARQCPKQPWSDPEYPVVNVSWFDARAYTQWLSKETGRHYRLPSEAEWEYAARAGTTTPYPFGNEILPTSARFSYQTQVTTPLPNSDRSINRNRFRLYNMVGNVAEWVEDTWHDNYQGAPTNGQPELGGNPSLRVVRGGSYKDGAEALRSAARAKSNADAGTPTIGFRVVEDLPGPAKSSAVDMRNDSGWLRAQDEHNFTLQLFAVRQPDRIRGIIRAHPDIKLKLIPVADDRFHYRLLYGVFKSRRAAKTAFGGLPADIVRRAGKPVVKSIADLQRDSLATTQ